MIWVYVDILISWIMIKILRVIWVHNLYTNLYTKIMCDNTHDNTRKNDNNTRDKLYQLKLNNTPFILF